MDYKILFYFILLTSMAAAYDDYSNYEDEYENTLSDDEFTTKDEPVTKRPQSNYEVTEIVVDVPDNRTRGPIITNYTIAKPINLAPTTTTSKPDPDKNGKPVDSINNIPFMPIIKEYLRGIKKGIIDGFNNVVNIHGKSNDGDDFDSYVGPLSFISKLHKQSSDAGHKFHNTLFGQKFDDVFNIPT